MNANPPDDPQPNQIWLAEDGELKVFDGTAWVTYSDVPDESAGPNAILRGEHPDA